MKKSRFFDVYDRGRNQCPPKSMKDIYEEADVKSRTARKWLSKQRQFDSSTLRKIKKLTVRLKRKEKLSPFKAKWFIITINKVWDHILDA